MAVALHACFVEGMLRWDCIGVSDITDLYCTSFSALKVCLVHIDGVLLRTEHPPSYYISSSVLNIVCTGCALLNALTGSQTKQAALHTK